MSFRLESDLGGFLFLKPLPAGSNETGGFHLGRMKERRAADGRPYEKAQSVWIAFRSTVGAPKGRPFCLVRSTRFFREPAILLSAGGRWPPLREGPNCAAGFGYSG